MRCEVHRVDHPLRLSIRPPHTLVHVCDEEGGDVPGRVCSASAVRVGSAGVCNALYSARTSPAAGRWARQKTKEKCCVDIEEWYEGGAVFLVPPSTQPLHRPAARQWVEYVGKAGPPTLKGVEH